MLTSMTMRVLFQGHTPLPFHVIVCYLFRIENDLVL